MDKRSLIGYILIGLVLVFYFNFSQPSEEEIKAEKQRIETQKKEEARNDSLQKAEQSNFIAQMNDKNSLFYNALRGENKNITLENSRIKVEISTYGGRVASATLKEHLDQEGAALVLFDSKDKIEVNDQNRELNGSNTLDFAFNSTSGIINTNKLFFKPVNACDSSVTMRLEFKEDKYIDFVYELQGDSHIMNLHIKAHNMGDVLTGNTTEITWKQFIRQLEPGYSFEQRFANATYRSVDDDSDYLSETMDDKESLEEEMAWIAYKNQFFSTILIAGDEFSDVEINSEVIQEGHDLLKRCTSTMQTPFDVTGNSETVIQYYFGPNKYDTLKESNALVINQGNEPELEDLIYFGWPIVRWINKFFIMPLFDILSGFGLNMGLVLILLTLIVKAVVYPFTKKSYISSAKMRALKPYIDEINAKYPNKEDSLKKQQEIMGLYSKYGASPMGGCLPMLIQMPIFIALFNFVPNVIELRQESFLWAHDLSSYDAIISWETPLPFIGNHLSLFCLLFCVTQILNTYYTSKMQSNMGNPDMEQQQKVMRWMMYFMPVMFFFIFNDYSSGLNFYYFLSTLVSVFIFIYLRRVTKEEELLKKMEAYADSNKNKPAKQTSMMARIEALQEQQRKLEEERARIKNSKKNNK